MIVVRWNFRGVSCAREARRKILTWDKTKIKALLWLEPGMYKLFSETNLRSEQPQNHKNKSVLLFVIDLSFLCSTPFKLLHRKLFAYWWQRQVWLWKKHDSAASTKQTEICPSSSCKVFVPESLPNPVTHPVHRKLPSVPCSDSIIVNCLAWVLPAWDIGNPCTAVRVPR